VTRAAKLRAYNRVLSEQVRQLKQLVGTRTPYVEAVPVSRPGRRTKKMAVAWYGGRGIAWDGIETAYVFSVGERWTPKGYRLHAAATASGLAQ
jgi:hypothetical protein